jgi:formylglycine-generating enzyme required for sulfatase activity
VGPVAVPQATVRAKPQAPVAPDPAAQVPKAVGAQPRPTATALPKPAAAQPSAAPVAVPQSGVRAVPPPAPAGQAGVRPAAQAAAPAPVSVAAAASAPAIPDAETDPLIGVQLGDYRVQQLLGRDAWGKLYSALQLSVNRRVGLKVLDPEMAQEEHHRNRFLTDARAKAAVQHPFIVSVFEADERNGLFFYTHESLDGATMEERIKQGQFLDEKTALQVMKAAAEGLQYLWSRNLAHSPLDASGLRVGADNIARLANIATADRDPSVTVENEIRALGKIIQQLVPAQSLSNGLRAFLSRMTGGANPVTSWPVVLQAVTALEPKVIPVEAAKIKAADAAAMRAMEAANAAKRRALYISVGTLSALVVVLAVFIARFVISNARKLDAQVVIPAGNYMVGSPGEGQKASLGEYEIDKYEVTINEYAKFIKWCKNNPDREHEFDHPRGERRTSHVDPDVELLIGKAWARGATVFKIDPDPSGKNPGDPGVAVDLNSPMVAVTFWDAYAYAQWRGKILEDGIPRDLPTEEEWEVAARGPKSFKYPWGDELKLKNFNSNQDYKPLSPGSKPDDGFNYWAPVDKFSGDVSGFGVVGMAGNVSEWVYRKEGNREIPLLKGGSFASEPLPMWGRILKIPAEDARYVWPQAAKPKNKTPQTLGDTRLFVGDDVAPSTRSLYIGFRTVKRK